MAFLIVKGRNPDLLSSPPHTHHTHTHLLREWLHYETVSGWSLATVRLDKTNDLIRLISADKPYGTCQKHKSSGPGRIMHLVMCLTTDVCLTADPGVASSIPARSHTFVEIDHEIISTVILLSYADSFKKGFCQLQAKVCAWSTV